MLRSMNRLLTLTVLMTVSGAALSGLAAAAPLADNLPAGALMTLQTNGAGATLDRILELVSGIGGADMDDMAQGLGGLLKGSIGNEATVGVFSVGNDRGGYTPALLAVSRLDVASNEFFSAVLPRKVGARVGKYTFSRDGDLFVGKAGGLVYLASDKVLLMNYLGRLSGSTAPRLGASAAYTVPEKAMQEQDLSLYFNFSATAKVIRGQLGKVLLPRLLSPIVDALGTLGSYAAGFSSTGTGLNARSAHLPNPAGKDKPLYNILTHTTDFAVQNIIPAGAESVNATACATETNGYLGRWLTRIDLLDPTGFLTDSQLAANLEQSARYLGDECAQVTPAGATREGLSGTDGTTSQTVTYQKVTDMAAAQAHLPGYARSLNEAIRGAADSLDELGGKIGALGGAATGGKSRGASATTQSAQAQLDVLKNQLSDMKLVYGFRGDYLITSFSQKSLDAALDETAPVLADDPAFGDAALEFSGVAGWSYGRAGEKISAADITHLLDRSAPLNSATDRAVMKSVMGPVSQAAADLYNRYQGMSSQSTVDNGVILNTSVVRYDWKTQ
jgi:hypothetical protein